jgi:DNA-directed RNA polymerase specialized sigma24 family protein
MMPKGGGGPTGLEVYYSRVEDLLRVRKKAVTLAELSCQEVFQITQACRDEKTRRLIHMVYIDDKTLSDACETLGMDYHAAYMRMHRELSRLDRLAQAR